MPVLYNLELTRSCRKEVSRLCRKNPALKSALSKKLEQVLETPHHFKPLKAPLQNLRRVHILGCFVLIYEIIEETRTVCLLKFCHHDDAY